jgi:hypothetical protein
MKRKGQLRALTIAILTFFPWGAVVAAPLPPLVVVNHEAKECSRILGGDECMDCLPPEGWEVLGFDAQCPSDYAVVENLPRTCMPFKTQFCCSEGHSGAHGDCEDLVINDRARQCAFVEDIDECELPSGWKRMPDNLEPHDWVCPSKAEWVDDLDCVVEQNDSRPRGVDYLPCASSALVCPAAVILWLSGKRRR